MMGDAENEVIHLPVEQIENWMDEALGVVDDGLENLITLVIQLNERTKYALQEIKSLECFRKMFIAQNFFMVPVTIAIILCYGTQDSVKKNSGGLEFIFQIMVMLLMFLATCVGLPFYIISLWESYIDSENKNKESYSRESIQFEDSFLTLMSESSVERLNELLRLLNNRMPPSMIEVFSRRRSVENDSSEERMSSGMANSSEIEMTSAITDSNHSDSVETNEATQDELSNQKESEFSIRYKFEVLMNENSPDLAVRFEPTSKEKSEDRTQDGKIMEHSDRESPNSEEDTPSTAEKNEEKDDRTAVQPSEPQIRKNEFLSVQQQFEELLEGLK